MRTDIVIPEMDGNVQVARWFCAEGDTVVRGDAIVEIEMDGAAMELQAFAKGRLDRILIHAGGMAKTGEVIGVLIDDAS